jgi:hypothetical protein
MNGTNSKYRVHCLFYRLPTKRWYISIKTVKTTTAQPSNSHVTFTKVVANTGECDCMARQQGMNTILLVFLFDKFYFTQQCRQCAKNCFQNYWTTNVMVTKGLHDEPYMNETEKKQMLMSLFFIASFFHIDVCVKWRCICYGYSGARKPNIILHNYLINKSIFCKQMTANAGHLGHVTHVTWRRFLNKKD